MKYKLALLVVTVFAFITRFYNLSSLPSEMHRDELAIGYNAYSLLQTGKDEHNKGPWPFVFESFGDYKLPGMIYMVAGSVKLLGMTPLAVRLPNVILATVLIPLTYLLITELWPKKNGLALLAAGVVASSIWHIFLSRTAYEPIAGLTLQVGTLVFMLKGRRSWWAWPIALVCQILAYATYNTPLLLAPLLLAFTCWIFRDQWRPLLTKNRWSAFIPMIGMGLIIIFFFGLLKQVSAGKLDSTLLTHPPLLTQAEEMTAQLHYQRVPHRIRQLVASPFVLIPQKIAEGYVAAFNPDYLFFEGSNNSWHNLRTLGLGNMNPALIPFIVTGLWILFTGLKERSSQWLLGYLLISPIPDAITIDAPLTNRLLDFHFALTLIAALGGWWWWQQLQRRQALPKVATVTLLAIFGWWWSIFAFRYYLLHTPLLHPDWSQGLAKTIRSVVPLADQYDAIIIDPTGVDVYPKIETAYIYLAFFGQLDPQLVQAAPWVTDGYHRIEQIGKYRLQPLPSDETLALEIPHDPTKVGRVLHIRMTSKLAPINKNRVLVVPLSIHQVAWEVEDHVYYIPASTRSNQK